VSLTDLGLPAGDIPSEDFGRVPPQDLAAEQSVLGGMLLSKDAIADVAEELMAGDFYRPAHELVYEAITDLYSKGEPADAVTVAAELTRRGEIGRVGGPAYLHTLLSSVPTAANAGFYARIVRERSILRRLVSAGTKIVQLGYATDGGDVEALVNAAQAEVYAVAERRQTDDYVALGQLIEPTIDEIEAAGSRSEGLHGVPTGFRDLDLLTHGLQAGQMVVIAARPAVGKALALDTPLPTPSGWTTMGEVQVGDQVIGSDGRPTTVVAATDVMLDRTCYEVHFSDGTVLVADAEHQWLTETRASRRSAQQAARGYNRYRNQQTFAAVRTTEQIAATLTCATADRRLNHSIVTTEPLDLPEVDLLVPPYTVGAWLGDGTSAAAQITSADLGIVARIEADGFVVTPSATSPMRYSICLEGAADLARSVTARLRTIGVLGDKHIPAAYLRASQRQRRELLAGLLDTDGTVAPSGTVQFSVTSQRLAMDVRELVTSLGYRSGLSSKRVAGRTESSSTAWTITFSTDDQVFELERKRLLHKERGARRFTRRGSRFITEVRPTATVPVRCIQVDNEAHLYLAGRSMVPTHNSTVGLDICRSAAIRHKLPSVIFSLEMSRTEITMRLLSAEAGVSLQNLRRGSLRQEDWDKLARTMGNVNEAPLFIDDSPNMSLMEIRAKCRRLKQKHGLRLVVLDYLQLMTSGKKVESRQQEVSEFSRALKLLAKELEVPVIAISQLNRGPEQRTDKRPMVSDLRESGCLTADTRILRADTGAETTMGELFAAGAQDVPVWSLDDSLRYVRRHLTHVFATGRRPVFQVRLASGKQVRATANHPFLTYDGWQPIGELAVGTRVAVPRHVPAPERVEAWTDDEVVTMAQGRPNSVPENVFHLPKLQIALFLRHLWAADGSVTVTRAATGGRVYYASTGRELVDGVALLLLRFGISGRIRTVRKTGYRDSFTLDISGSDDQRRFLGEIGVHGARGASAAQLLEIVRTIRSNPNADTVPVQVWDRVRDVLAEKGMTHREFAAATDTQFCGSSMWKHAPGRERLGRVAAVLDDAELEVMAVNDVLWDEVVAVEPDGEEEVYDATVLGNHNFVANGIVVHNSIEQDADMVILLHREDMYEKESPRAGEADFIVAKHRNGPTDTITVAFQGHYSRFVDMAT
jgi:replicative DNA helicase